MQPGAGTAGEDDAFSGRHVIYRSKSSGITSGTAAKAA